jgi:hypothetical protein
MNDVLKSENTMKATIRPPKLRTNNVKGIETNEANSVLKGAGGCVVRLTQLQLTIRR